MAKASTEDRIDRLCVAAVAYAKRRLAHASWISLVPLWQAALRLSAARLRATREPGADVWATRLEQLAEDEDTKTGAWVPDTEQPLTADLAVDGRGPAQGRGENT